MAGICDIYLERTQIWLEQSTVKHPAVYVPWQSSKSAVCCLPKLACDDNHLTSYYTQVSIVVNLHLLVVLECECPFKDSLFVLRGLLPVRSLFPFVLLHEWQYVRRLLYFLVTKAYDEALSFHTNRLRKCTYCQVGDSFLAGWDSFQSR